jgi:AraC-like DNA-binding protein
MIYILAILEVVIGIIFAFVLSYKNAKPIIDIFNIIYKISPEKKNKQDYNFLKGTISSLVDGSEALKAELDKQASIVRSDFIRRLVNGSIPDDYKVKELSNHRDYNLEGSQYAVLIVKNTGYGNQIEYSDLMELDNAQFIIQEVFVKYPGIRSYHFNKSENEIVFLMIFNHPQTDICLKELETMVNIIEQELSQKYNLSLIYLCGGFSGKIEDLSDLYNNAVNMLCSGLYNHRGLLQLFDRDSMDSALYYPIEVELKLIKNVQSGQQSRIAAIITGIYQENLKNRRISEADFALLNRCIYLTALRASTNLKDYDVQEKAEFLLKTNSHGHADKVLAKAVQLFEGICDTINNEKIQSEQSTQNEILKYMEESLYKSTFSLYDVSLKFNYVETYLYKYFKEKFGLTFSAMLEDMRMKKACTLLSATDLSIEEIAADSGYNSSHAFRRVFKKYKGLLPTEYRELIIKS